MLTSHDVSAGHQTGEVRPARAPRGKHFVQAIGPTEKEGAPVMSTPPGWSGLPSVRDLLTVPLIDRR